MYSVISVAIGERRSIYKFSLCRRARAGHDARVHSTVDVAGIFYFELHVIRSLSRTANGNKFTRTSLFRSSHTKRLPWTERTEIMFSANAAGRRAAMPIFRTVWKKMSKLRRSKCNNGPSMSIMRCEFAKLEYTKCRTPTIHVLITKVLKFISFGDRRENLSCGGRHSFVLDFANFNLISRLSI